MISFRQDLEKVDKQVAPLVGDKGEHCTIVDAVHFELGLKTKASREFLRVAMANALLMDRKQEDYGSENISDFGLYGVVIKINDKTKRLKHLMTTGRKRKAQNEAIVDSLRDLSNYGIIGLIVDAGTWPNE